MLQVLKLEGYSHISPLKLKPQIADTELQNWMFTLLGFCFALVCFSSLCLYFVL